MLRMLRAFRAARRDLPAKGFALTHSISRAWMGPQAFKPSRSSFVSPKVSRAVSSNVGRAAIISKAAKCPLRRIAIRSSTRASGKFGQYLFQ